jgi:hypothetical protein
VNTAGELQVLNPDRSFANGNGPNGIGLGGKPLEVAAAETTSYSLVNQDPRHYAS